MDSGEEIPGLNEDWNFLGANLSEWSAGLAMFFVSNEILFGGKAATAMPALLAICVSTTIGLATLRKKFPDETRGVRNYFMTLCGFNPPGIPAPADLQSSWSGAPTKNLPNNCDFNSLKLAEIFPQSEEMDEEEEKRRILGF